MSLAIATWTGAVATVILAVGAIVSAVYAVRAFRAQSTEVRAQQEEFTRQAKERQRAQASRIYITMRSPTGRDANPASPGGDAAEPAQPPFAIATVHNTGQRPVYDLRIHWVALNPVRQAGTEDRLDTLGPGERAEAKRAVPDTVKPHELGPVAYFLDAAGVRWTLFPGGHLELVPDELPAGAPLIATTAVERWQSEADRAFR